MALRQLAIAKKLNELRSQQAETEGVSRDIAQRREALALREAELTEAMNEVTAESTEEEKAALEEATNQHIEAEKAVDQEEDANNERAEEIRQQIATLEKELDEINARAKAAIEKKQERKGVNPNMETRSLENVRMHWRDKMHEVVKMEESKQFLQRLRESAKQERAVTGAELAIPDVYLGLIRERTAEASKLLKHVNLRRVRGTGRMIIAGSIPEAVWTEMCATINEMEIGFNNVELDGYKVGGYIAICNALYEDSDIDLGTEAVNAIGGGIGLAVDKAIVYGTGTKMPQGIVARLAQTEVPDNYPATQRAWADLHTSNLIAISNKSGIELFKAIAQAAAAAKGKFSTGEKFWVMNESTKLTLTVEAMNFSAAGAIVTGQQNTMPIVGGVIETLEFMPDGMIVGGYGDLYAMLERAGVKIRSTDILRMIEDQTVFVGTARYDGKPVIAEGFVGIGINGTAPAPNDVTFAPDTANP